MGIADLIPGISGGTIALIAGVYQDFIKTLSRLVNRESLDLLKRFKLKDYFIYINAPFIIPLATGIFFSIIVLSRVILYILEEYPLLLWAFFFGLILASSFILLKQSKKIGLKEILIFIIGTIAAYLTVSLPTTPSTDEAQYVVIFFSGLIALSAMMLPGISGSFLLVIMGQYPIILKAISEFNFPIIITFAVGGALSLVFFSKFIHYLMERHSHIAISLLAGFLLGSLKKIWPWKVEKDKLEIAVTPQQYTIATGEPSDLIPVLTFIFLGIIMVLTMERWGQKKNNNQK